MKDARTERKRNTLLFFHLLCTCLLLIFVCMPSVPRAETISGKYLQTSGTELTISINAGKVPPSSVILIQHFPAGIKMLDSRPRASNYNVKKNSAKWLLKGLRPGNTTIKVTLDKSVSPQEVSAEILYRPLDGGKMTTIQVAK